MLAALGPRLQRLSMQGLNQDFVPDYWCHTDLVPTILTHCTMLVHLQVENVLLRTAVDKVCVHPATHQCFGHERPSLAATCLTCTAPHVAPAKVEALQVRTQSMAAGLSFQVRLGSAPLPRCSELHLCRWTGHKVCWWSQSICCPSVCTRCHV